ncbi:MAG: carboxypeptidase-like regulatory domain-containing protein [Terracidiphilus sp.]
MSRGWINALLGAVLMMSTGTLVPAQSAAPSEPGSLSGKLTDLYSKPLEGVTVILRQQATGAEAARAVSARGGLYHFNNLPPGEYTLEARSAQLGSGLLERIVISAGYEARVQAAMRFEPLATAPSGVRALLSPCGTAEVVPSQSQISTTTTSSLVTSAAGCPAKVSVKINRPLIALESTPQIASELPAEPLQLLPLTARATALPTLAVQPAKSFQPAAPGSGPIAPTSTTTTAAELQNLPVSGRRWQDFVLDNAPTSATPAGGQAQISLRGSGQQPVESAVDGVSRSLAFGATSGSGQHSSGQGPLGGGGADPVGVPQPGAGGHGLAISESAIRAVETAAGNVEAVSARAAGGRMNVETQRGSNELHGQGFFFDRQNSWGARNPFTQWITETTPNSGATVAIPYFDNYTPTHGPGVEAFTPPDHESVWGIGLGSRIRRDKLFWFAALDGYNRNDSGLSMVKHPYLLQLEPSNTCANPPCTQTTGFFAQPSNDQMQVLSARLGLNGTNPVAEGWTAYSCILETLVGMPGGSSQNCPADWPLDGLLGPSPRTAKQWTGFGRLDWQVTERQAFTLEAIGAYWNSPGGGLTRVSENYGSHSFGTTKASEEWLLGRWEAYITPNLLAVTQASAGSVLAEARPQTPSAFEQTFLAGNAYGQLPEIVVDNRYGFTIGNPARLGSGSYPDERLYQAQESVDWIHDKLLLRSGFNLSHNADSTSLLRNQTGTYTYSNVENFVSDALAFESFGLTDALDPDHPHNCDETGKVWRDSGGGLRGLGNLPCYSYYSQTMGPNNWHLTTNDWAIYSTAQWQPTKRMVLSAGMRWEREQRPPPLAALRNAQLPLTQSLPALGNNFGPRMGMAFDPGKRLWPLLRIGYGIYYGRTENRTLETVLTQTGSLAGDLSFFLRPTDDLPNRGGGAPPFPYVLAGEPGTVVKPGAVELAGVFHNPEIHQAIAAAEETLPGHIEVTASAVLSLGRRLPISIDTNLDPTLAGSITYAVEDPAGAGPIKATQITVPLYASWPGTQGVCPYYAQGSTELPGRPCPDYQQITNIESRANSTYEAGMIRVERYGRSGLTLHAHYTYGHAMDWNPNESSQAAGNDALDPADFGLEYGVGNDDIRHSIGAMVLYETPWKLSGRAGKFANDWMLSGIVQAHSGLPYTMRTSGTLAECFASTGGSSCTPPNSGANGTAGAAIVGLGPGMNGSGGDNRVYGMGNDHVFYNIGRNTYRYPATWKADLRLGKRFDLGNMRRLELLAESFNLLNHQNVTEIETNGYFLEPGSSSGDLPTLNFMTGPITKSNGSVLHSTSTGFGQPLNINATNFYRERQFQFGLRLRF